VDPVWLPFLNLPETDRQPSNAAIPTASTGNNSDQYITIGVNGQELKILRPAAASTQVATSTKELLAAGTVHGRLLQKGTPLSNCYVVIVPWPKEDKSDSSVETREPMATITNDEGRYTFEHVPSGEYKLTWLPNGTHEWIRRIAMRPDVIVPEGQDVTLKDIRMAMRTIN
jgi:hypothetical protein